MTAFLERDWEIQVPSMHLKIIKAMEIGRRGKKGKG